LNSKSCSSRDSPCTVVFRMCFRPRSHSASLVLGGHLTCMATHRCVAAAVVSIGLLRRQKVENCKDDGYGYIRLCQRSGVWDFGNVRVLVGIASFPSRSSRWSRGSEHPRRRLEVGSEVPQIGSSTLGASRYLRAYLRGLGGCFEVGLEGVLRYLRG